MINDERLERDIEIEIVQHLKKNRHIAMSVEASLSNFGVPDIIANIYGFYVALEVKRPKDSAYITGGQKQYINLVNGSGDYGAVVTSVEDVDALIVDIKRHRELLNSVL